MGSSFEVKMRKWNDLRERLRVANASKDHAQIVTICDEVLTFSSRNRDVAIVDWMFDKRAAKSHADQNRFPEAVARIERAIVGCEGYRATQALSKPDDFVKDIETMRKSRERWGKRIAQP